MKIIVTMAGESNRFKKVGIKIPKYEIMLHGMTLFEWSMLSLKNFYEFEFIFVALKKNEPTKFIEEKCTKLGINIFKVILLDTGTKGQAETVYKCRKYIGNNEKIIIYNIDTYFNSSELDIFCTIDCDGLIPVFYSNSNNFSFIKPYGKNLVSETKEKIKISNLATIGLYYFSKWSYFLKAYKASYKNIVETYSELYIAPIYNYMINSGKKVKYIEFSNKNVVTLGTPEEIVNVSKLMIKNTEENYSFDKYIVEKYKNNYNNCVFKLLINKENYILKFYKNKRKMDNEIRISSLVQKTDCDVYFKGYKNNKYYIIRKYIEGELLCNHGLSLEISVKLGQLLRKMHSTKIDNNIKINSTKDIFFKWLKNIKNSNLDLEKIKEVFCENFKKFDCIFGITHMDFRLGNIIINESLDLKLIDFEHSKVADIYFDFVKIRQELIKYEGFWLGFKEGYGIDICESKIDFFEFVLSIGAIAYIFSKNRSDDSFYYENVEYINQYIKKY